jgi:hypothetical protein
MLPILLHSIYIELNLKYIIIISEKHKLFKYNVTLVASISYKLVLILIQNV